MIIINFAPNFRLHDCRRPRAAARRVRFSKLNDNDRRYKTSC